MKVKLLATLVMLSVVGVTYAYRSLLIEEVERLLTGDSEDPIPVMILQPTDYAVQVRARGELTGLRTTSVRAPAVRGSLKVAWLEAEGTLVRAGDPVVRFDDTDALLTLQENQTAVQTFDSRIMKSELDQRTELRSLDWDREAADLEFDYANNQVRRDETIFTRWEIQESLMSAALAEYRQLSVSQKAELRGELSTADRQILVIEQGKAQSEVNRAQRTLSSLELTAPTSGVLIYKRRGFQRLEIGTEVYSRQELIEVADLDSFRSEVSIVEADVSGIRPGKKVRVTLDAFPDRQFEGVVETLSKVAEQKSRRDPRRYFGCDVSFLAPPEVMTRLKPGMRLEGTIEVEHRESAFILPKSAVFKEEDRFLTFVRQADGFREHPVQIIDSDHGFYVVSGVNAGDAISLRHPFRTQELHLPDFSGPKTANQKRRFIMVLD